MFLKIGLYYVQKKVDKTISEKMTLNKITTIPKLKNQLNNIENWEDVSKIINTYLHRIKSDISLKKIEEILNITTNEVNKKKKHHIACIKGLEKIFKQKFKKDVYTNKSSKDYQEMYSFISGKLIDYKS